MAMKWIHMRKQNLNLHSLSFKFFILLIASQLATQIGSAAESKSESETASTYGELLLIEQKEIASRSWQVEASGMQEFSNPYLDISGVSASLKKSIGPFVFVGPEYTRYFVSESEVNKSVSQALRTDTISQTVYRPRSSIFGVASVVPVAGHLNLFSRESLPFELELSLGYGAVQYEKKSSEGAFLWRVGPRAFMTKTLGLQFQFGQEIESPFSNSKLTKSHARLGLVYRF